MSIWRLMAWQLMGNGEKSCAETTRLVHDVLLAEDFNLEDISGFNAETAIRSMDRSEVTLASESKSISEQDGWKTDVNIDIQVPSREKCSEGNGRVFTVHGLAYRPLVSVIRAAFMEAVSKRFHLTPFKRVWKSPVTGKEQRLYDELYTSDIWNKAHDDVQKQRREDGCTLERVIAGLMFWSDSTHLAQFGHATAWPVYLFFGNLSKYERASAGPGPCHPVAFIPSLPESLLSFINSFTKRKNHMDLLAHCKRELFHAVWRTLLDDEFVEAYRSGIVIGCHDGVLRRVYPRIFTYSADYPEKIILATIRDKGLCPCPRCCLPKSSFNRLGFASDLTGRLTHTRAYARAKICAARRAIYQFGNPVKGTVVERILKDCSLVPTLNSFAERLSPFQFNIFVVLVVDLMHEFELGVLKSILKHLIRILYSIDPNLVSTLNEFSAIPPFGVDGICRFPPNVAEMRQWVARHFEDMLQTHELPSEVAARHRRQQAQSKSEFPKKPASLAARPKSFNILTYKFHALGDYTRSIRMFGSTDSYTTQTGELAHRLVKKFYRRTNKRDVATGLTKQERRQTRIRRQLGDYTSQEIISDIVSPDEIELSPELHHIMRALPCNAFNLASFLRENQSDPAVKNFVPKMKDHLLSRLYGYEYDGDEHFFTDDERNDLRIIGGMNQVIESTIVRVNYTTYDIRREQDVMRPGSGCFIMTLSREDGPNAHPFWYAQVLRALHINVLHVGPNARCRSPQDMELLWVCWLGVEPQYSWGFREARLPKVGFVPEGDYNAFGFLDPSFVIRGCHLIPSFSDGRTTALLQQGASVARHPTNDDDWYGWIIKLDSQIVTCSVVLLQ
ncbi:hypothetical protein PISMIDRAFT_17380 [Pisolithus microcarpus 441]|uniref:Uncharacterized protein n=1 Tax=Pisolithus microcarpus 441 TaxID=765257 RepID=A0A0C9Z2M7_9AGAM|nr:hypothetical protein PISMIDRAFT_17380 [Pisolithus microcarpus 441]